MADWADELRARVREQNAKLNKAQHYLGLARQALSEAQAGYANISGRLISEFPAVGFSGQAEQLTNEAWQASVQAMDTANAYAAKL